jgi:hypothetical protein
MTQQEMATEIVKVWLAQRGAMISSKAATEIKEVFLATVKAISESYEVETEL